MGEAGTDGLGFSLTLTYREPAGQRQRFGIRTQYAWMRQTHVHDKRVSQNTYPTTLIFLNDREDSRPVCSLDRLLILGSGWDCQERERA
jgi:hypothetical protein